MPLELAGYIELPPHVGSGGFDHAAIHERTRRLYVAHTANDAVDVIDCERDAFVRSIGGLTAVAGALVSEERGCVFTSNRGENTVGIFQAGGEDAVAKVPVGVRPNGLAFDHGRGTLIAANVGDPSIPGSFTLSVVDVASRTMRASIPVPGRTRWAIYDPGLDRFFVNIMDPPAIVVVAAADPTRVAAIWDVAAVGPHGLDFDAATGRLLCACDDGQFIAIDAATGRALGTVALSGAPDVVFLDAALGRCYVAIGDPGVVDVIDVKSMRRMASIAAESGAHTTALDAVRHRLYVFLPATHRAAVLDAR